MPSYKLYYFNARARAELTRFIFAATETSYEDIRVSDWPEASKHIQPPFGQIPVLEVDGVKIGQSLATARYVAKATGLAGDTLLDQGKADMIVDSAKELMDETIGIHFEKDPVRQAERTKAFREEKLPKNLGHLEKILESNGVQWFVGKKLNWADLAVIDVHKFVENEGHPIPWAAIPKLQAHRKRIEAIPVIASYMASRPNVTR